FDPRRRDLRHQCPADLSRAYQGQSRGVAQGRLPLFQAATRGADCFRETGSGDSGETEASESEPLEAGAWTIQGAPGETETSAGSGILTAFQSSHFGRGHGCGFGVLPRETRSHPEGSSCLGQKVAESSGAKTGRDTGPG